MQRPTQANQPSHKNVMDAGADARHLMAESAQIRALVTTHIILRQLFLLIQNGLVNEIAHGWDVQNPELVIQTLGLAAQEKAVDTPITATQLRQHVFETLIPVLDIFCHAEITNDRPIADQPATGSPTTNNDDCDQPVATTPVSGSDNGTPE